MLAPNDVSAIMTCESSEVAKRDPKFIILPPIGMCMRYKENEILPRKISNLFVLLKFRMKKTENNPAKV